MNVELILGLPWALIHAAYAAAPGNEIASGTFASPESSAAFVANTFGLYAPSRIPVLVYLHAEPTTWPDGTRVPAEAIATHRAEVQRFADLVEGDEVRFLATTYSDMLLLDVGAAGKHA